MGDMRLRYRRVYFILMVILFSVIAFGVIAYSLGWRYSTSGYRFQKVGSITVSTEPRDASIFVDGQLFNKTTPATINNLLAQTYQITIHKDGYYDWSRAIPAHQDKVSRIPKITLLKKQSTLDPSILGSFTNVAIAPSQERFIATTNQTIALYTLIQPQPVWNMPVDQYPTDVLWSPDEQYVLVSFSSSPAILLTAENGRSISVADITPASFLKMYWSASESDILYGQTEDSLLRINIFQRTVTPTNNLSLEYHADDMLIYRSAEKLGIYNAIGQLQSSLPIPQTHTISVNVKNKTTYLIIDQTEETLFAYDPNSHAFQQAPERVQQAEWSPNNTHLLLRNAHEIWHLDLSEESRELIIRTSEDISQAAWLMDSEYVIYQTEGRLTITETQGPERNEYTLTPGSLAQWAVLPLHHSVLLRGTDGISILSF